MKQHLNLIPRSVRRKQLIYRRLRYWLPLWGVVLVLCGVLFNTQHQSLIAARQYTSGLDAECEQVRQLAVASGDTRNEIAKLQQQARWLRSLEQSGLPLLTLAAISQSTSGLSGQVQLDRLQFEALETSQTRQSSKSGDNPASVPAPVSIDDRIDLTGTASDDAAVSSLIARLEFTGLFSQVELVGLQSQEKEARHFQIRCVLQATGTQLAELDSLSGGETTSPISGLSQDSCCTTLRVVIDAGNDDSESRPTVKPGKSHRFH